MIDFNTDDTFEFWVPMQLVKAASDATAAGEEPRRLIQGLASTDDLDLQNETVDQRGIDFSYFLKHGYYNNDHKPGFENKVGQPMECKVTPAGLWTKGFLFRSHKIANSIWELANALEVSKSDRKLGFSIQGKVTRRQGRRLAKCWIQDIAITAAPINTHTWLDVLKSLNAVSDEMWSPSEEVSISPRLISPVTRVGCGMCAAAKKSLLAIDESQMDLRKDHKSACNCGRCKHDNEDEEKALGASSVPSRVESLDSGVKDQNWADVTNRSIVKALSYDECVDILCQYRDLSRPDATVVVDAVFTMSEQTR